MLTWKEFVWYLLNCTSVCFQAVIGGQHFGTKSLVMSWYQPPPSNDDDECGRVVAEVTSKEEAIIRAQDIGEVEEGEDLEDELNLDDEGEVSVVIDGLEEEASIFMFCRHI